MMKLVTFMTAAGLTLLPLTACGHGAADNPLIGTWKIASGDCLTVLYTFTASNEHWENRAVGPYAAETGDDPVTYNLEDPKKIDVMGNLGVANAERFDIVDADHILHETAGECTYERLK